MKRLTICILSFIALYANRVDLCLDPGHGGGDPGYVNVSHGPNGPYEKDFNLNIGLLCEMYAPTWNVSVSMTRRTDEFKYLTVRKKIGEGKRKSAYGRYDTCITFVSIHCNGVNDSTVSGTETWYWPLVANYALAYKVQLWVFNYICNFLFANNRGVKDTTFTVLTSCYYSSCLLEAAFMSHDISPNAQWFQLKDNHNGFNHKIAWGILDGVSDYITFDRPILQIIGAASDRANINLAWSPCPVGGIVGYNVYRATYPDTHFILIAPNIPDTFYTDNSVSASITYAYYVKGINESSQESVRSNVVTGQIFPFSSTLPTATGLNNSKKTTFNSNGKTSLAWINRESIWSSFSSNYGASWAVGERIEVGNGLGIDNDNNDSTKFVWYEITREPEYTLNSAINFGWEESNVWHNAVLYNTTDSILSVSFAIDPLDTGWVVFNTYDDEGNNELKIGQFYTQSLPESLEGVLTLDTYTGMGVAALDIKVSDRSIHVVYEKNNKVMYLRRNNLGEWTSPQQLTDNGYQPSLSIAGDLIHIIWLSRGSPSSIYTQYTNGVWWSKIQRIAYVYGWYCYPYMEKGSIATWQAYSGKQYEVYSSKRTIFGSWSPAENISQTSLHSRYPQVAMYQTISQTNLVYVWTEGNESPYEVKILPVSLRSNPVPLYAFNLGKKEPSVFLKHRSGYVVYEESFEKSADYDTSFLHYKITGLDPNRIYHLGLVFYQDETNGVWEQEIEIDNCLIKKINLPRKKITTEKILLSQKNYQDGIIELKIKKLSGPKVVLSAMSVWEFSKENHIIPSVEESSKNTPQESKILAVPNPVKDKSLFHYQLPKAGQITIKIYAISGQLVREIKENKPAGLHTTIWDGKDTKGIDVASGIYFYRVESTNKTKTGKIIFLR